MYQFYVVSVKQLLDGSFEHNVQWTWDEDATKAQRKAESKYHEILAAGAIDETTLSNAAIVFSAEGFPLMHDCYKHAIQQEPVEPVEGEE